MNEDALKQTVEEELVTFFSRSKGRLWTKGETSGNTLHLVDMQADCDNDTLLILANPQGPTCHTGKKSCFNEKKFKPKKHKLDFLMDLEALIYDRKAQMPDGSYTTYLFEKGVDKIAQKVGEEAVETVIESKSKKKKLIGETADLLFHLMVLLAEREVTLKQVVKKLKKRHKKGNHKHLGE